MHTNERLTSDLENAKITTYQTPKKIDWHPWFFPYLLLFFSYLFILYFRGIDTAAQPTHPIAPALCLIPLLFSYKLQCKIKKTKDRTVLILLSLPLLITAFLCAYKLLLLVIMSGFFSLFSNNYMEFTNPRLYSIDGSFKLCYLNTLTMAISGTILFHLNIFQPYFKTTYLRLIFKIIFGLLLAISAIIGGLFCFISSFPFAVDTYNVIFQPNKEGAVRFVKKIPMQDSDITVYLAGGGAVGDEGSYVRQEKTLSWGVRLVKDIYNYVPCSAVNIKIVNPTFIRISSIGKPDIDNCDGLPNNYRLTPFTNEKLIN